MNEFKILLIVLGLTLSNQLFSQDLIIKKNGDEIESVVVEITESNIKYRKYTNSDGPIYSILKSEVFMIKYKNGEKDIFNEEKAKTEIYSGELRIDFTSFGNKYWQGEDKISKSEFKSVISKNIEAENSYLIGSSLRTTGLIFIIPSSIVLGWQVGNLASGEDANTAALTLSGVGFVGSIILDFIGMGKIRESINIYNKSHNKLSFKPSINANGIGLVVNF